MYIPMDDDLKWYRPQLPSATIGYRTRDVYRMETTLPQSPFVSSSDNSTDDQLCIAIEDSPTVRLSLL